MQNNASNIIANALNIDKSLLNINIKDLISDFQKCLENNKDVIFEANKIDKNNSNGFILDFNVINNIFSNIKKNNIFYGDVIFCQKDAVNNIVYGKQIMDYGNVVIVSDGNPYVTIEMALRNLMAGNTSIFLNNGFMFGTNQLLINLFQSVLIQFKLNNNLIQIYVSDDFDEMFSNFANIDLIVCIGNRSLQNLVLSKSKNKTIVSGYESFDLYIEDETYLNFLDKIINIGLNIQLYIQKNLNIDYADAIIVNDVDEAIAQINYNGSKYSSAIFTKSSENASRFIREVKSKIITVNTSPTIERILDINQSDLINEKTIIYPFGFQLTGNEIKIPDNNSEV